MSKAWDIFFNYGNNEIIDEIEHDIYNGVTTRSNKLFFNRSDSVGIVDYENYPCGFNLEIYLKYKITKWIAFRNGYLNVAKKDRRIAVSQSSIDIKCNNGNVDIFIQYIPFISYNDKKILNILGL